MPSWPAPATDPPGDCGRTCDWSDWWSAVGGRAYYPGQGYPHTIPAGTWRVSPAPAWLCRLANREQNGCPPALPPQPDIVDRLPARPWCFPPWRPTRAAPPGTRPRLDILLRPTDAWPWRDHRSIPAARGHARASPGEESRLPGDRP